MAYGVVIVDEEGVLRLGLWPSSEIIGRCQRKAWWTVHRPQALSFRCCGRVRVTMTLSLNWFHSHAIGVEAKNKNKYIMFGQDARKV